MLDNSKTVIEYDLFVDVRGHMSVMYSINETSSCDYFIEREI